MPNVSITLAPARVRALRDDCVVVEDDPALLRVNGPGALQCMQGLLTNDIVAPGDGRLVYGALLTPKGMIVVDQWVLRVGDVLTLVAPRGGHDAALEIFRRSLPPRLARVDDLSGDWRALWCLGARSGAVLEDAGLGPLPEGAGHVAPLDTLAGTALLARGTEAAPFAVLIAGPAAAIATVAARLRDAGAAVGDADDLAAARILAGWPALGAEIDERTLPQEARYDEIGGVSYTKGCYTGQETVARLHFRGHTNRDLRGLLWQGAEPLADDSIVAGERDAGRVRSTLAVGEHILGLAPIRREVETGDIVLAGGRPAAVVALPFDPSLLTL